MQTLEQFQIGARLSRGRSYARRGQVLSIDVQNGVVEAQVQGSRKRPYDVEISVRTISPKDWERLRQALAEQPVIAASLLAGRMPENIEDTFRDAGLSMFPERGDDLETDCSCPDWSNPCKHIAAVYLLLGEEFDRDPFLIFRMRGMDRADLLGEEFRQSAQTIEGPPLAPEPLPEDPEVFWANSIPALANADFGAATMPDMHAALPPATGSVPTLAGRSGIHSDSTQHLRERIPEGLGHLPCTGPWRRRCRSQPEPRVRPSARDARENLKWAKFPAPHPRRRASERLWSP